MRYYVYSFVIALILLFSIEVLAQPPAPSWMMTYGNREDDLCYSAISVPDGGFLCAGYTKSFGAGQTDMYLVKVDSNGMFQWHNTFGDTAFEECLAVQVALDGGYILGGKSSSFSAGDLDMYLVKTDSAGNLQWQHTYGDTGMDYCSSVCAAPDGGYILAGYTNSHGAGDEDCYAVKTDSMGNVEWEKLYGGGWNDKFYDVVCTPDGGYLFAGSNYSISILEGNMYAVKTDSLGDVIWENNYGGDHWERCESIDLTTDGGYIFGGNTYSFGAGEYDMYIVKVDSLGNFEWQQTFGDSLYERCHAIVQTDDLGYILAGFTQSFGAGSNDIYIVKTDSMGNFEWEELFGGSESEISYSIEELPDKGYIIGGYTESYGLGEKDMWIIRLNGELNNSVGKSYSIPLTNTLKLNCCPNPFNSASVISFDLRDAGEVSLVVYDVTGREVQSLVTGHLSLGYHEVVFDGADLSSGMYFVRLTVDSGQSTVRKAVLMK